MSKIAYYVGPNDLGELTSKVKCAMIHFDGGSLPPLPLTKRFNKGEEKKGYEQLKRWVSSAAFTLIILDGFGDAFANLENGKEVATWIKEHSEEEDFPSLLITGNRVPLLDYPTISEAKDIL